MNSNLESKDNTDKSSRVEFVYTEADGYRLVHGSGAYGEVNAQGNIVFEIYTEHQLSPDKEEKEITEDNQVIDVPQEDEKTTVRRAKQIGIVMSLEEAKAFDNWLQEKIEDLEE